MNTKRVRITSCTDNFIKNAFCSVSGIDIDKLVIDEIGICDARDDLSEEGDRFLVKFLWITNIAKSDWIKGVIYLRQVLLVLPFLISSFMLVARVGTTPLTAYSATWTLGLI